MKKQRTAFRLHLFLRRALVSSVLVAVLAATLSIGVFAQRTYKITDGSYVSIHKSYATDPHVVLDEAGFALGNHDTYTTAEEDGIHHIDINRVVSVTINNRGSVQAVNAQSGTVADLLKQLGIVLEDTDKLSCSVNTVLTDGMEITITHTEIGIIEYEDTVPFPIISYESDDLVGDETKILTKGQDGTSHFTAEVIYENGKEISRQILSEKVLTPSVAQIVLCSVGNSTKVQENANGTYESFAQVASTESAKEESDTGEDDYADDDSNWPDDTWNDSWDDSYEDDGRQEEPSEAPPVSGNTFTTAGGETLTYSRVLTCTATGYSCEGYTGYTYTGTVARVGAIAVDPSVIPLGSRLYIVTNDGFCIYGFCTAEDTGSAVKGNFVDLYFDTIAECYEFGYRTATVYILD